MFFRKVLQLDLLTPARTWAPAERLDREAHAMHPAQPMPLLQRVVMFLSVVGPIAGLLVAIALLWHRRNQPWQIGYPEVLLLFGMYACTGFGVTIGYHRLLTHRSFETTRPLRLLLAILGAAAGQGMVIRWCATHRRHHQQADRDGDPHSPHLHGSGLIAMIQGFWHAHVGWVFGPDKRQLARSVPDLLSDRSLLLIDRLYFLWIGLGLLLPALLLGCCFRSWHGFFAGLLWGGLVRICLMQHVTWSVNSVCHIWGRRPFNSGDHSTNNMAVAVLSLGEGWHNNHHAFPTSARHGLRWWQFDPSYFLISIMKRLGLAWNVRLPSGSALAAKSNA
ncbi:MAG TPA: acyl-CoA desaturase [Tepidisphaeraceae bacterium]